MESLTGKAERLLGSALKYKELAKFEIPAFKYPPQVQKGVEIAAKFGVKVPTDSELMSMVKKEVDPFLKGIQNIDTSSIKIPDNIKKIETDILQSIDWLF